MIKVPGIIPYIKHRCKTNARRKIYR